MKSALQQLWKIMGRDGIRQLLHNDINALAWRWHEGFARSTVRYKVIPSAFIQTRESHWTQSCNYNEVESPPGRRSKTASILCLHVLHVSAWVLCRFSSFPPGCGSERECEWLDMFLCGTVMNWQLDQVVANAFPWRHLGLSSSNPCKKPKGRRNSGIEHIHTQWKQTTQTWSLRSGGTR